MPEGKIRVHELAKSLGVSVATVVTLLGDLGVKVADQTDLVDASLEARLKGLVRRPSLGGRGLSAARPEPTWLTSLRWPKREPEEPEATPAPGVKAAPPSEAPVTGATPGLGTRAAGAVSTAVTRLRPHPAAEAEETPERVRPGVPRPAAEEEEEERARPPVERAPGRTLPSGRAPVPPPPLQRPERPAVQAPGRPGAAVPGGRPAAPPARPVPTGAGPTAPRAPVPGVTPPPRAPSAAGPVARPPAVGAPPRPAPGPSVPAGRTRLAGPPRRGQDSAQPTVRAGVATPTAPVPPTPGRPGGFPPSRPTTGTGPGVRPAVTPGRLGPSGPGADVRPAEGGFGRGRARGGPGVPRPEGERGRPGRIPAGERLPERRGPAPRDSGPRLGGPVPGRPAPVGRGGPPAPAGKGPAARGAERRRGLGGVPSRGRAPREMEDLRRGYDSDDEAERRVARLRHGGRRTAAVKPEAAPRVRATEVVIEGPITVRELAERMGITGAELIKSLISMGMVASLNQLLDPESARLAVSEMGVTVYTAPPAEREAAEEGQRLVPEPEDMENLRPRPPVVTVMGHVDHGKTSLLDAIRKTNVTAREAGGITQHIGASTVDWKGKRIVFLDTPGHEAFTAMRARGAQVTDLAVLVVAADDGVMPQTVEAINHARAAKVPIIVALNKIDKPNALPDRVKKQLSELGLTPEEWGGDTVVVPVSAKERTGIDDLLDMILLVAEMADLKANPDRRARGVVIETRLDRGLGPVATVLVQAGTLRVGDPVLAGTAFGRVRAMVDDKGNRVEEAGPSTPVEVTGLDELPLAGDIFQVLADERMAREIASRREQRRREQELGVARPTVSLAELMRQVREGERRQLNLIIKADVQGSLEALRQSLEKLEDPEVGIEVIHSGVGGVTESDVTLAATSDALIIAFNVTPDAAARQAAEERRVEVRTYRVIYDALNDIKAAVKGLRAPVFQEVVAGHAVVKKLFRVPKVGVVAGCLVSDGKIARRHKVRVVRDGVIVHEGEIASLKHLKDDVREIAAGFECGIGLVDFQDVKEGDVIEAYTVEEVTR